MSIKVTSSIDKIHLRHQKNKAKSISIFNVKQEVNDSTKKKMANKMHRQEL